MGQSFFRKIGILFAVLGPGIIAAAAGNDAGGIATYSLVGSKYGFGMLWVMVPVTVTLVVVQEMCARLGVISKKGLADLIREAYGVKITFLILGGLLLANLATVISEFAGIASSLEIFSIPRYVSVPIGALLVWVIVTRGNYRFVERIFLMGAVLYIAYIISGFLAKPDWVQVAKSTVVPTLHFDKSYMFLLMGIIGTTITPWMQFFLQSSVVEKSVDIENYKFTKIDVYTGSITASVVSFFIMVAAAATLNVHGIEVQTAADAAIALEPFAGRFAEILFAGGLLNASLLGAMIVPIATAYYICEGLGFESGLDKSFDEAPWFRGIFTALIILGAIPALFPQTPLISVMLGAQVINGILLAPVLIFIVLLINKTWLMGNHVNTRGYNVLVWAVVGVVIALSFGVVIGAFVG